MNMANMLINLGSGQRRFTNPPWTNIDCQAKWDPDIVADGAHLDMIADGAAEMVVLHHVLEHFDLADRDALLRECWRVLASGGRLIVCVPNMRALVRRWTLGQITDDIFLTNTYGAYMGDEADRHKWAYTRQSLEKTLANAAPWSNIAKFDDRKIEGADIAGADWWILSLEATK